MNDWILSPLSDTTYFAALFFAGYLLHKLIRFLDCWRAS